MTLHFRYSRMHSSVCFLSGDGSENTRFSPLEPPLALIIWYTHALLNVCMQNYMRLHNGAIKAKLSNYNCFDMRAWPEWLLFSLSRDDQSYIHLHKVLFLMRLRAYIVSLLERHVVLFIYKCCERNEDFIFYMCAFNVWCSSRSQQVNRLFIILVVRWISTHHKNALELRR
jgi:hypothetical protein